MSRSTRSTPTTMRSPSKKSAITQCWRSRSSSTASCATCSRNSRPRSEKAPVVQSFNEWDPLEEVVVGTVLGAVYPECGPILAAAGEPEWLWHYQGAHVEEESGQAAHEPLEEPVRVLEGEGVKVRRGEPVPA